MPAGEITQSLKTIMFWPNALTGAHIAEEMNLK